MQARTRTMTATHILAEIPSLGDSSVTRGVVYMDHLAPGVRVSFPPQITDQDPTVGYKRTQWVILSRADNGTTMTQIRSQKVFHASSTGKLQREDACSAPELLPMEHPLVIDTLKIYFTLQLLNGKPLLTFARLGCGLGSS